MATFASAKSGLWSAADTWVGGVVPANLDTITITAGHTVVFDVNQSAFANGLASLVINGVLEASTNPGTYYLKMRGHITGTGSILAGTQSIPYPVACKFTIFLNGAYRANLTAANAYQLWCSESVIKYVKLSQTEAAGQTELSIDTDVTGETDYWKNASIIRIDNINNAHDTEERTIASITATTINITAGLTKEKIAGSLVILVERNVTILGTGVANNYGIYVGGVNTLRCEIRKFQYGIIGGSGIVMYGVISGCTYGIASLAIGTIHATITGCSSYGINQSAKITVYGLISGCAYAISNGIQEVLFYGIITGATEAFSASYNFFCAGEIYGCGTVFWGSSGQISSAAYIHDNLYLINDDGATLTFVNVKGNGCRITEPVLNSIAANPINQLFYPGVVITNLNGVAGEFRIWSPGGSVANTALEFPVGFTRSYKMSPISSVNYCFMKQTVSVKANAKLQFTVHFKKDASMAYLPRVMVSTIYGNPFLNAVDLLYEKVMESDVNDTWVSYVCEYLNPTAFEQQYAIYTIAKNAAGNVYTQLEIADLTSGVSRARIAGGV